MKTNLLISHNFQNLADVVGSIVNLVISQIIKYQPSFLDFRSDHHGSVQISTRKHALLLFTVDIIWYIHIFTIVTLIKTILDKHAWNFKTMLKDDLLETKLCWLLKLFYLQNDKTFIFSFLTSLKYFFFIRNIASERKRINYIHTFLIKIQPVLMAAFTIGKPIL